MKHTIVLSGADSGGAIPERQGIRAQEDTVCGAHSDPLHDALLHAHAHGHFQCLRDR